MAASSNLAASADLSTRSTTVRRLALWHGAWAVVFVVATLLIHGAVNGARRDLLIAGVPSAIDAPQGFVTPAFDLPETSVLNLRLHGAPIDPTELMADSDPNVIYEGALVVDGGTQSYGFTLASELPDATSAPGRGESPRDREASAALSEVRLSHIPKGRYVLRMKAQPGHDPATQQGLQLHVSRGGEGKTQPLIVLALLLTPLLISLLRVLRAAQPPEDQKEVAHAHG